MSSRGQNEPCIFLHVLSSFATEAPVYPKLVIKQQTPKPSKKILAFEANFIDQTLDERLHATHKLVTYYFM